MVVLWTVPIVAATVAVAVVLSQLRKLEDVATELGVAVRRSRELRPPLVELRRELARSRPLVDSIYDHWHQHEG
jgi:hypothetical protein